MCTKRRLLQWLRVKHEVFLLGGNSTESFMLAGWKNWHTYLIHVPPFNVERHIFNWFFICFDSSSFLSFRVEEDTARFIRASSFMMAQFSFTVRDDGMIVITNSWWWRALSSTIPEESTWSLYSILLLELWIILHLSMICFKMLSNSSRMDRLAGSHAPC